MKFHVETSTLEGILNLGVFRIISLVSFVKEKTEKLFYFCGQVIERNERTGSRRKINYRTARSNNLQV